MLKSVYKEYAQKSRVFLYPVLGIKRGNSIVPIDSYISWEGYISILDMKLVCLYHLRSDSEYKEFERTKLLGNPLYSNFKEVDDNKGVYIFNLDYISSDWDCFITGKYSKMSIPHKRKIRDFFGFKSSNYDYVDSYLSPEKYFKDYSKLLEIPESELRRVGELCSPPDLEKETLSINVRNLQINDIIN